MWEMAYVCRKWLKYLRNVDMWEMEKKMGGCEAWA